MPAWASSRKLRSSFRVQHRQAVRSSVRRLSPTRPTSTGYRKPMRAGSRSIWTPRACAGFRQKFDIGERRADHQQGVAFFDRFLRRLGAEQADAAGRIGLSSGTAALPSSALMIGAPSLSATCFEFVGRRPSAPWPHRIAILLSSIQNCRRPVADVSLRLGARARREQTSEVWSGNIALRAFALTSWSCKSTGKLMCATPR